MTYISAVEKKRQDIQDLCDALQALYAFNYQLSETIREQILSFRHTAETASAKELRSLRDTLILNVKKAADAFGCVHPPIKFSKWFKAVSRREKGILQLPKWYIDDYLFKNYLADSKHWQSYPPHTYIALDYLGEYERGKVEYYLPEAVLCEDMCLAFNNAFDLKDAPEEKPLNKIKVKTLNMSLRTAVLSSFYFVEAYLNGVAFDFEYRNSTKLTNDNRELLLEYDFAQKKEKWVNFRRKLLQYPKVILSLPVPPLTETNCPEMQTLLTYAKEIRDSVVHQSPKVNPITYEAEKIKWMFHLGIEEATEVVDSAVSLVRKLNTLLKTNGIKLDWLTDRDTNTGKFPQSAFD
jgi:hypothetical protein